MNEFLRGNPRQKSIAPLSVMFDYFQRDIPLSLRLFLHLIRDDLKERGWSRAIWKLLS